MAIIETWWAWVAFGIVLMLLELMMPSYLFLGFGFGAIVTGIALALGITMSAQYRCCFCDCVIDQLGFAATGFQTPKRERSNL